MTTLAEAYYRRLRVEEFYNPSQPRDKEGQWTKMWSGVSAHPQGRTPPKAAPITIKRLQQSPEHISRQIYDADLGGGYRSEVDHDDVWYEGGITYVRGDITLGSERVGYFKRSLFVDDSGRLVAEHDELFIDRDHQGKGLADRFNMHAVEKYQKYGVDRIELMAGSDVGGFAWARQGFRHRGSDSERQRFLTNQLDRTAVKFNIPLLKPHEQKLKAEVDALRRAIEAGEDVQPIHLASIGETYARYTARDTGRVEYETWPGKELLLGTGWGGVYYFDANSAVTAAASSLKHAELRPAFKTQTPVEVADLCVHGEFACHDPSCRPPTSGGTGGSSPRHGRGFGGPSAHPDRRTKPRPQLDAGDFTTERMTKVAKQLWGDDVRLSVSGTHVEVAGEIRNKYGDEVGWFERQLKMDRDGVLSVDHTSLTIDDVYQGRGYGAEWNARAIEGYRALGVDHVTVHAADEVGGYAWAREGFRVDAPNEKVRKARMNDLLASASAQLDHAVEWGRIDKDVAMKAFDQLDALHSANQAGEDVLPIHIASIGEDTMRYTRDTTQGDRIDTWPGKDALLGTDWYGVYYFDANKAVTAAAQPCEHGNFACHDASCRPPTSGGTGGSRPRVGGARWTKSSTAADIPDDVGEIMKIARKPDTDDGEVYAWSMLERMYEARGYNGKPRVISRGDMLDKIEAHDVKEGWRGVMSNDKDLQRGVARSLIDDDKHRVGRGVLGDGTYVAVNTEDGQGYLSRREAEGYGTNMLHIGIPKSISENNYDDIRSIATYGKEIAWAQNEGKTVKRPEDNHMVSPEHRANNQRQYDIAAELVRRGVEAGIHPSSVGDLLKDTGRVAVLLGMDGYVAGMTHTALSGVDYAVVLNRSAIYVDESVYNPDGITVRHAP